MIGFIFYAILALTYAFPWVKVADEWYAPGQLVIPYLKFFLTQANIIKRTEESAPSIGDVMVYEKGLRYLGAPPSEGGPHNQITFELMAYAMVASALILLVPLKFFRVIGYLLALASSAAFTLAMFFIEGKLVTDLRFGLFANIGASLVFLIASFFI
ncbi:hypothetical protein TRFO_07314 [Tritrichomonas foetus]|uniref:Transmembrane protein n=1 Tax=Tritrichomonas foetus TaxID=1144522 RepID=A0A1J4JUF6_9EUKA|nr:hypothetical protein TRFO_07314 [Tritrichomonas foetus]|eukprot:OHT02112.1 hypothetical protein TRFO_07314 [Tritrichomonas foetus]